MPHSQMIMRKANQKKIDYNLLKSHDNIEKKMTAIYHPNTKLEKHDSYMTPKYAWENIKNYLAPYKEKIIWEAFYGDGKSAEYLRELGMKNVIHKPYPQYDFFDYQPDHFDITITNIPFSKSKEVLTRLKKIDKPFCLIMPTAKMNTQYFRKLFENSEDPIQIIIPRKRIHFKKLVNGEPVDKWKSACCFDCFYYCYKMNLPRDIIWLKDSECVEMKKKGNHKSNRKKKDPNATNEKKQ